MEPLPPTDSSDLQRHDSTHTEYYYLTNIEVLDKMVVEEKEGRGGGL